MAITVNGLFSNITGNAISGSVTIDVRPLEVGRAVTDSNAVVLDVPATISVSTGSFSFNLAKPGPFAVIVYINSVPQPPIYGYCTANNRQTTTLAACIENWKLRNGADDTAIRALLRQVESMIGSAASAADNANRSASTALASASTATTKANAAASSATAASSSASAASSSASRAKASEDAAAQSKRAAETARDTAVSAANNAVNTAKAQQGGQANIGSSSYANLLLRNDSKGHILQKAPDTTLDSSTADDGWLAPIGWVKRKIQALKNDITTIMGKVSELVKYKPNAFQWPETIENNGKYITIDIVGPLAIFKAINIDETFSETLPLPAELIPARYFEMNMIKTPIFSIGENIKVWSLVGTRISGVYLRRSATGWLSLQS